MNPVKLMRSILFFGCLVVGALMVLFPFIWMLSTSLKVEGKGMSFDFMPHKDATVGLFEFSALGTGTGPSKDDRTNLAADSMVQLAFAAPEALAVEVDVSDGPVGPVGNAGTGSSGWTGSSGAPMKISLKKDADGVWKIEKNLPAGAYKYTFEIHRNWKGAVHSLYTFQNYRNIAWNESYPFLSYLGNSFLVAISSAFLTVFVCSLAAYVFAKKNFPGKQVLFWMFMGAMMIPGMMYMVPQFAIITSLGWINSLQGLVVPHLANIFGLFMLKQMMESIPDSLFEAARIDGAGEWTVFRHIVLPLSLPSLAILFLLTFVGQWNNFLWQLIVNTPDSPLMTLPVGLKLFKGQYETHWEQMMAASSFSIIPIVALFLFTQKFLIEGLTAGGVKE